ncbi:MAG: CapA family protein [Alphaproteobacteria bacterium]|nr:CapA family protein [Alphaproteobacteria bacterium]
MIALLMVGCGPYARWPEPTDAFPHVFTPVTDLEPYEDVRWETETWDTTDPTMTGLYVQKALFHRPGAPVEEVEHYATMREALPPLGAGVRLAFAGDVMHIDQQSWATYTTPAHGLFEGADLRVGNLETPTSPDHSTEPRALGLYAFNAPPEMLDGLPFDVLQLNNNHSLDAGDLGLENTVAEVEARGFVPTGVDAQARVEAAGETVALLAYTWGLNDQRRSDVHELFIVPFGHIGEDIPLDRIREQVAEARDAADHVVVLLHWGFEYEYYPDPHFLVLAREIVAAGADLVVGEGPHVVQPPELCHVNQPDVVPGIGTCSLRTDDGEPRTAAVLYSLGNFGTDMFTLPCQVGIVATVSLDASGVTGLGWEAVASITEAGEPLVVPLTTMAGDPDYDAEAARLEAHLGAGWKR